MHLPNRPFSYRETPEDLESLRSMLKTHALPHLNPHFPTARNILNLACGRSDETGLLAELFAPPFSETQFTGIDIRAAELDEATARWSVNRDSRSHMTSKFINLDATKLPLLKQIPQPTHLVFFRHQNFWNGPQLWTTLFDHALHQLHPQGLLIITSYFDKEHLLALSAFESLGAKCLVTAHNPRSREIPQTPGKSVDRHIAVLALTENPSGREPSLIIS